MQFAWAFSCKMVLFSAKFWAGVFHVAKYESRSLPCSPSEQTPRIKPIRSRCRRDSGNAEYVYQGILRLFGGIVVTRSDNGSVSTIFGLGDATIPPEDQPSSSSYIKQLPVVKVLRFLRAAHRGRSCGLLRQRNLDGAEDNPFGLDLQQDRIVLWRGEATHRHRCSP